MMQMRAGRYEDAAPYQRRIYGYATRYYWRSLMAPYTHLALPAMPGGGGRSRGKEKKK